jgi:hypothetical protein
MLDGRDVWVILWRWSRSGLSSSSATPTVIPRVATTARRAGLAVAWPVHSDGNNNVCTILFVGFGGVGATSGGLKVLRLRTEVEFSAAVMI